MVLTPEGKLFIFAGISYLIGLIWCCRSILKWKTKSIGWKASWLAICLLFPVIGIIIYVVAIDKIYKQNEIWALLVSTLLFGFMFSFREWGITQFSVLEGLGNFLKASLLAGIALSVHTAIQKRIAIKYDAFVEYRLWPLGIAIAILGLLFTNGYFIFAAVFAINIYSQFAFRPGRRQAEAHLGPWEQSKAALAGPIASILLAAVARGLFAYTGLAFFQQFMYMNILLAVFHIIPFSLATSPWRRYFTKEYGLFRTSSYGRKSHGKRFHRLAGEYIIFGSRPMWVFSVIFIATLSAALWFLKSFVSVLLALLAAFIVWLWFYYQFEKDLGVAK